MAAENHALDFHIFLIGFMGAGKSTVAAALQTQLGMELLEMDEEIARREGMPIPQIFEKHGEEYFREVESRLIAGLAHEKGCIVSCGGGAVLREKNVAQMKQSGRIVLLTAKPQTIYERVKNSKDRPILNGHMNVEYIESLMEKRRGKYMAAADYVIETDDKSVEQITSELMEKCCG